MLVFHYGVHGVGPTDGLASRPELCLFAGFGNRVEDCLRLDVPFDDHLVAGKVNADIFYPFHLREDSPNGSFTSSAHHSDLKHHLLQVRSMRAVVQRVKSASVTVDGKLVSQIGPGLLCLAGLKDGDTKDDAEFISRRLLNARLWPSADGKKSWDQSVVQKGYEVLLVSQFTLFGLMKGNKPDFHIAMPPSQAQEAYSNFVGLVRSSYLADKVQDGVFGAMMEVQLVNDGPVTMAFDSEKR